MQIKVAPFLRSKDTSQNIMQDVLIALIPVTIMAIINFGIPSLIRIAVGISSAVMFEYGYQSIKGKDITISDLSAMVTGLLLALSLPPTAPLWVVLFGTFVAIVIIKQMSGGIGKNTFNPAVFARVLIKILFTPWITNWVLPGPDQISTATPLEFIGNGAESIREGAPQLMDLLTGQIGGNMGEMVKWAILIGFIYLVVRKVIDFKITIATLLGLFLTALLFGKGNLDFAVYHIFSGTVMFASVFMVTDYTSGPLNAKARIYYALFIGVLTGVLRYTFALPGGIGIAILIANLCAPLFDGLTTPRVFGHKGRIIPINSIFRR